MAEYKYTSDPKMVLKYPATSIAEGSYDWVKFQKYLDEGGQVDPWKTDEELKEDALGNKLEELKLELDLRATSALPKSNSKNDTKIVSRMVKLIRKEMQGRASENELAEIDLMEALDDYLDNLTDVYDVAEKWLEEAVRTLAEINEYDVKVDPNWPIGA